MISPSRVIATQRSVAGQLTPRKPVSEEVAAGRDHAPCPPCGLVDAVTSPVSVTATHSATVGHERPAIPFPEATGLGFDHSPSPPEGFVDVAIPVLDEATQNPAVGQAMCATVKPPTYGGWLSTIAGADQPSDGDGSARADSGTAPPAIAAKRSNDDSARSTTPRVFWTGLLNTRAESPRPPTPRQPSAKRAETPTRSSSSSIRGSPCAFSNVSWGTPFTHRRDALSRPVQRCGCSRPGHERRW